MHCRERQRHRDHAAESVDEQAKGDEQTTPLSDEHDAQAESDVAPVSEDVVVDEVNVASIKLEECPS